VPYNILSIRSPTDPADELYPDIADSGRTVTMNTELDGSDWPHFAATNLSVWELQDDKRYHRLGGFSGARHSIFVTDYRVVVHSPKFKKAESRYLRYDMPGFYLASALTAAIRTHGRALTGQVLHMNVFKLSVIGTGRRKEANRIRLYLRDETEVPEREIFLQITFKSGTDPRPIAQLLARRIAGYWLRPTVAKTLDAERAAVVRRLSEASLLAATGDQWMSYQFPFSIGVARKGQKKTIRKVPEVTRGERLAGSGETCRPPFRWLDFSNGAPVIPREWGIHFTKTRSIMPDKPSPDGLVGICHPRGMYLAGRSSHLPVLADGQRRVLYGGNGMFALTADYLLIYLMYGTTLVGSVDHRDAGRLLVATPISEIASIGITSEVIEKGTLVDKGSPAAVAIFPRDRAWGATWIAEIKILVQSDGGSKLEPISLVEFADRLVSGVGRILGIESPLRREMPSGVLYDLSGTLAAGSDASDSSMPATCSSCRLGKGPEGYPCVACGGTLEVNR